MSHVSVCYVFFFFLSLFFCDFEYLFGWKATSSKEPVLCQQLWLSRVLPSLSIKYFLCGTSERTFPRTRACGDTEREGETDRQTETEREIFTMTTMQFSSLSSSTEYYEGSHRDLTTFCCRKTAGSVTMCITSCTFTDVVMGVGGVNPQ